MKNNEEKFLSKFEVLGLQIHKNNIEKGFWPEGSKEDPLFKDQALMLVITEVSEAVESVRISKFAQIEKFENSLAKEVFVSSFEDYIKDTFEDECADIVIRLLDYAVGCDLEMEEVIRGFKAEMEALKGIKIIHISSHLLTVTRSITDIKCTAFDEQYLGEAIAKIFYLVESRGGDLNYHIENKIKYNKTRKRKHGKDF